MPIPRSLSMRERKTSTATNPTTRSSIPDATATVQEVTRSRTLLPKRSSDENHVPRNNVPRSQPSRPKLREASLQIHSQGSAASTTPGTAPTRRYSLMRPDASRSSNVAAPKTATSRIQPPLQSRQSSVSTVSRPRPHSPKKTEISPTPRSIRSASLRQPVVSTVSRPRPPSPKKTEILPPPRSVRSASLRQPVTVSGGSGMSNVSATARGHTRHRSQVVSSRSMTDPAPVANRQFSTYQPQSSLKNQIKPPTPTGDFRTASGLIPTSWPEIAALQTELLQLSLFYSSSLERQTKFKKESESRLKKKYDTVAILYRSVLGDEKRQQQELNGRALGSWLRNCHDHRGPHEFTEQIQILSQILQEISDLLSRGKDGRYDWVVTCFNDWFEHAESVRQQRALSGILDATFIDPLDRAWKEEATGLRAKLELCARELQSLDLLGFGELERLEQSALTRVVRGLTESIQLMIEEIQVMITLETELICAERKTVSQLASHLTAFESNARVGVWRTGLST
ncbi:hypothetical protein N7495_004966 [Penicillium taxi]|uniref:uncharacterized protein n=1 Tax=Penicillium taxi TaxID=168475 RepID=UPI002545B2D0|nr:uncharacterized protein N7495_004966 [Penicillium taxi]KAJ5893275.1 hypothetical protein N7495_004966 [Penicillium taxi]